MQLIGDGQAEDVGDKSAVQRCQQGCRHERAEFRRIGHVGEHLHHADQRADHPEGRRAVADGAIDFLALVEVSQEIVAVALEIVANEFGVIAVGDEADAFGQIGIFDLDLLQTERTLLAGDFGDRGDLVNQFTLGQAPHGEGELRPQRQAVNDRTKGKADQRSRERSAKNDNNGVIAEEHPDIATHQHDGDDYGRPGKQAKARGNIHDLPLPPALPLSAWQ